jgi:central kinetochore subunit Mal2/MCM21
VAKQDLDRFVRTLRREIQRYHNRLGSTADLRRNLIMQQGGGGGEESSQTEDDIVQVGIADIEAKQVKLSWADDRSGRLVMDDDGRVVKLMVFGPEGARDWDTTIKLTKDGGEHIEDVVKTFQAYARG